MKRRSYTTIIFLMLLGLPNTFGQNSTSSPYSKFGFGERAPSGTIETSGMGGTSLALPSRTAINYSNPASYSSLDSCRFYFSLGLFETISDFTTMGSSMTSYNGNFTGLTMGFRMTPRWHSAFGLIPFTQTGYHFQSTKLIEGEGATYDIDYQGKGGLNKFFWGNSFLLNPHLSLGLNVGYFWGSIEEIQSYYLYSAQEPNSYLILDNHFQGWSFDLGIQGQISLSEKTLLRAGVVASTSSSLSFSQSAVGSTALSNGVAQDTISLSKESSTLDPLPMEWGLGLALNHNKKWLVALDYKMTNYSDYEFPNTCSWDRLSLGIELTPNNQSRDYWEKIHWQLGIFQESGYLQVNDAPQEVIGFSGGFGLPIGKNHNYLYLSGEWAKKSMNYSHSIKEDYFKITLGIALKETWFLKRKFE